MPFSKAAIGKHCRMNGFVVRFVCHRLCFVSWCWIFVYVYLDLFLSIFLYYICRYYVVVDMYQKVEQKEPCDFSTLTPKELRLKPMGLRWKYDPENIPVLHSVIVINIIMCLLGIVGAVLYLELLWEQLVLSLCYFLLFFFATLNQGMHKKEFMIPDIVLAACIFLLNIYFYARACAWGHFVYCAFLFTYFLLYGFYSGLVHIGWYELHTNIWHLGVVLLIILLPFHVKQENLF